MKIYCASRDNSDSKILSDIAGKDIWIKVNDRYCSTGLAWYRILSIGNTSLGTFYTINRLPWGHLSVLPLNAKTCEHCILKIPMSGDKFTLVRPIEMVYGDELFQG